MNTRNIHQIFLIPLCLSFALLGSCAKDDDKSSNEINKEYIEGWVNTYYPGVEASGYGIYILEDQVGSGDELPDDYLFAFINYTATSMDGNVSSTTDEDLAKQIGTFSNSNYYGTNVILRQVGYNPVGLIDILNGMRVGGIRRALVPGWLNSSEIYDSAEKYFKKASGTNTIYTVKLEGMTDDIIQWQLDTLEKYKKIYMDDVEADTTMNGFYLQQLKEPDDTATLSSDTTFYINYTGKLLNGLVFDTTIEDTAKVHGIYSSSSTYSPVKVNMSSNLSSITLGETNASSVVTGFAYCLSKLRLHEKVRCAFTSQYGYGYSGSGSSIPSFAPLVFEIEMVDEPSS